MSRDKQFQGFAEALWEELDKNNFTCEAYDPSRFRDRIIAIELIARRAYDLVEHSVGHSLEYLDECGKEISGSMNSRIMPSIPDMTELPKEQA